MEKGQSKKNTLLLLLSVMLLFAVGCCRVTENNEHIAPPVLPIDSLWVETGNAQLDSLLQLLSIAPPDTNLAKLYCEIGEIYENEDFEKAKEYYLKLKKLSEQLNWNEGYYLYVTGFTNLLVREELSDSAVAILQEAHELAVRENDEMWATNMLVNKGSAYFGKEWFETALTCYMEALPVYEQKNATKQLQTLYYMMAQLYQCINATEKAIEYSEKSVALDPDDVFALCALAMAYSYTYQNEKAMDYYEKALHLCKLQNNVYLTGVIYWHLATDALFAFDLDKAEKYVHQSLEISEQFGHEACCNDYILLSKLEQLKGNSGKSEAYAMEALQIATEIEALEGKKSCYMILAELAVAQGKYRENIQYLKELDLVEMDIAYKTTLRSAEDMATKYKTAEKVIEIEQQRQVISRQNMHRLWLTSGVAVCVVILVLLWYVLNLRNRSNRVLAEINSTKDKFFSIISHDMKNPAISQRDSLKMLINNISSLDNESIVEYLNEILLSAEGEVELLYNLLNWAQLQTGRMSFIPTTFNLSSCLRPEIVLIQEMAKNKEITFTSHIPDEALVTADRNMIATVVRNLLTNAVKFTDTGGTVMLSISSNSKGKAHASTIVSVTDTGIGMSETRIRTLFCLDCARSTKGTANESGSGIGLIVCKEMLEKHRSTINVEGEERKGSRFWSELKTEG
jgi:signal transduction histidine kinase